MRPAPFALALLALAAHAASAQLTERTRSTYITLAKAGSAQSSGYAGQGVLVAVLDTGVLQTHPEFSGRLLRGKSFTGQGDPNVANDGNGHGTHVAGIIAAARNNSTSGTMGMAYAARILPVKVLTASGSGNTQMITDGLRFAISKDAPIVNMSLGASSAFPDTAFREAVAAGQLIVAAAGNSGLAQPGWPARFAKESWALGQIIAVGAVDANNVIASFSNRAGDTASNYIVAPGVNLRSTYLNNGYASLSGTSMAAPVVSGAAAQIKGRWSHMSASQIADLLFTTATDLGAAGTDAVYGRGLLNVSAAMAPVGMLSALSVGGRVLDVRRTSIELSPAMAGLGQAARLGRLRLLAFDDYQRDFEIDLGAAVSRPAGGAVLAGALAAGERRVRVREAVAADGTRLAFAVGQPADVASPLGRAEAPASQRLLAAHAEQALDDGGRRFAGFGFADQAFGLAATAPGRALAGVPALADPYLALVPQAAYAGAALPVAGGWLAGGWLGTPLRGALAEPGPALAAVADDGARARAATLEYVRPLSDHLVATVGWRQADEAGRVLGTRSQGALDIGDTGTTSAAALGLAATPAEGWTLAARAAWGRTAGSRDDGRLFTALSDQHTAGWALVAARADGFAAGDRLALSLEQPLRTRSGSLTFDAVTGLDERGFAQRSRQTISLVPAGRERRLALSYGRPLALADLGGGRIDGWLELSLALRHQPDHLTDVATDTAAALRWQTRF